MVGRKRTQSKTKAKAKPVRKGGKVSKKNLKKVSGGVWGYPLADLTPAKHRSGDA